MNTVHLSSELPENRQPELRHDWSTEEVRHLYQQPFVDLLFEAQTLHRRYWDPHKVQASSLLSIKTGACPEDCAYCPQSLRHNTDLEQEPLMDEEAILEQARKARDGGAGRFCMGAAWRSPKDRDLPVLESIIKGVRELGLETCMTLGMLSEYQSQVLADAGLDYYNHNLDSSSDYYKKIITTRSYQQRLDTLENVRKSGMKVCCGGIAGMGEERADRIELLRTLANLPEHPHSVPINMLVKVSGTPLEDVEPLDELEFVRIIATARIIMPGSVIRLSAGREEMSDALQALAFFAGANSIFFGEKLLTTANPDQHRDLNLLKRLGLKLCADDSQALASKLIPGSCEQRQGSVAENI